MCSEPGRDTQGASPGDGATEAVVFFSFLFQDTRATGERVEGFKNSPVAAQRTDCRRRMAAGGQGRVGQGSAGGGEAAVEDSAYGGSPPCLVQQRWPAGVGGVKSTRTRIHARTRTHTHTHTHALQHEVLLPAGLVAPHSDGRALDILHLQGHVRVELLCDREGRAVSAGPRGQESGGRAAPCPSGAPSPCPEGLSHGKEGTRHLLASWHGLEKSQGTGSPAPAAPPVCCPLHSWSWAQSEPPSMSEGSGEEGLRSQAPHPSAHLDAQQVQRPLPRTPPPLYSQ